MKVIYLSQLNLTSAFNPYSIGAVGCHKQHSGSTIKSVGVRDYLSGTLLFGGFEPTTYRLLGRLLNLATICPIVLHPKEKMNRKSFWNKHEMKEGVIHAWKPLQIKMQQIGDVSWLPGLCSYCKQGICNWELGFSLNVN